MVRIGAYAKQVAPLHLALGKSAMLAVVSAGLLSWDAAAVALKGEPLAQLWPNPGDPVAWAVIAYSAVGPGALAAYFHVKVSHFRFYCQGEAFWHSMVSK